MPTRPGPDVICVLGMHRSGTSVVTRTLNLLGMHLGASEDLMPPAGSNPTGFWEHRVPVEVNTTIQKFYGGDWCIPPVFPAGWEFAPELSEQRRRARAWASHMCMAPLWGWKDPRACLTLPFWQRLLPPMRYILCLRNPLDVARSLERRDRFSLARSAALWFAHVRAALEATSGHPRLLIFYEDLFEDRRNACSILARFLGRAEAAADPVVGAAVDQFISGSLRHHCSAPIDAADEPKLAFPAKSLYLALRLASRLEERTSEAELQSLLDAFAQSARRAQEEDERLVIQLTQAGAACAEREAQRAAAASVATVLTHRLAAAERTTQSLSRQLADAEARAASTEARIIEATARLTWKRYRYADALARAYVTIRGAARALCACLRGIPRWHRRANRAPTIGEARPLFLLTRVETTQPPPIPLPAAQRSWDLSRLPR